MESILALSSNKAKADSGSDSGYVTPSDGIPISPKICFVTSLEVRIPKLEYASIVAPKP